MSESRRPLEGKGLQVTTDRHPNQHAADRLLEELLRLTRGPDWEWRAYGNGTRSAEDAPKKEV